MKSILLTFLLFFIAAENHFPQKEITGIPPIRNFSPKEYQSAPDNWSCIQDKRGIMYFANGSGVLEYDGARWNIIQINGNRPARSLAVDASGRVYVGSVNDFGYLDVNVSGEKSFFSLRSLLPDTTITFQEVWKTYILQNEVIFHTDNIIYRYRNGSITAIPVTTLQDYSFVLDDRLFVYQSGIGLSEIVDNAVTVLPGGNFYRDKRIRAMLKYNKDLLLIGTENGLYFYDGKKSHSFASEADDVFLRGRIFSGVKLGSDHYVFNTTGAGVVLIDKYGKLLYHIRKQNGLLSDMAFTVCTDNEQGVWVAQMGGISRIDFNSPITFADSHSGFDISIMSLVRYNNKLIFGAENGIYETIYSSDRKDFTLQLKALPALDIQGMYSFEDGIIAGCGEGTFFYHNGTVQKISPAYSISFQRSAINPKLFYGADYSIQLLYYHNKQWIDKGIIPGIKESIDLCVENKDGSLWLFTHYDGIIHVSNHFHTFDSSKKPVITRYGLDEGLPSLNYNSPVMLRGRLFFSTIKGLYSFDSLKQHFFYDSLFHSSFSPRLPAIKMSMFEGKNGDIYSLGLSQRWKTNILYYRRTPEGTYKSFPTSAGLIKEMNITPLLHESSVSWFTTGNRLIRFDRDRDIRTPVPFETRISKAVLIENDSVIYFGYPLRSDSVREIDFSFNAIRFEFSGMSYAGEENEFQYILEGIDNSWSQWTTEKYKEYSLLPQGNYRFRVRAKNVYGKTGDEASFAFTVMPPWWGTWWFRGFIIILFLIIGPLIYYRRVSGLQKDKKKQQDFSMRLINMQEQERKRISSELHDSIGQNLLIIKNMLEVSAESSLSKDELNTQLKELSNIASLSIEETRNIASNLHPYQLNRMGLTKAFNAMMRNLEASTKLKITCFLDDVQGIFNKETEAHIYRIVQESVNNVLKHSGASSLNFLMKKNSNEIRILISDNGRGFDIKEVESKDTSLVGGLGLFGLKERARIIGGTLVIFSEIGKGTDIELIIPPGKEI
ncbi:MAG: histidine kinase [Ignavibacteriaceae bacterium]